MVGYRQMPPVTHKDVPIHESEDDEDTIRKAVWVAIEWVKRRALYAR